MEKKQRKGGETGNSFIHVFPDFGHHGKSPLRLFYIARLSQQTMAPKPNFSL